MTNLPVEGQFEITCAYGEKGNLWKKGYHEGMDFSGHYNTEVFSTCDGVVEFAGNVGDGFGNYIRIKDNANPNRKHYFLHLSKFLVKVNDKVNRTTKIGIMGSTGNSTGVHLHYEIRENGNPVDPSIYMTIPNKRGVYNTANYQINTIVQQPIPVPQPVYLTVNTRVLPLILNEKVGGGKKLASMSKGSKVELVEKTNASWYKVNFNGIIGYASTQYLK